MKTNLVALVSMHSSSDLWENRKLLRAHVLLHATVTKLFSLPETRSTGFRQ